MVIPNATISTAQASPHLEMTLDLIQPHPIPRLTTQLGESFVNMLPKVAPPFNDTQVFSEVGGWTFHPSKKIGNRQIGLIFPMFRGENNKDLSCHHHVFCRWIRSKPPLSEDWTAKKTAATWPGSTSKHFSKAVATSMEISCNAFTALMNSCADVGFFLFAVANRRRTKFCCYVLFGFDMLLYRTQYQAARAWLYFFVGNPYKPFKFATVTGCGGRSKNNHTNLNINITGWWLNHPIEKH